MYRTMYRQHGFTLIELLVTVVMVAILGGIVAPSFEQFIKDNRLSSQINNLIGSLHIARSEATNRGLIVTICASSDSATCNTNNWENGWIIFTDANNSGNAVVDGSDEILRYQESLDGGNTLRTSGFNFTTAGQVLFGSNGFMQTSGAATSGTFTLCDDRGATEAKGVILTIAGASRLAVDEDNDVTLNDHDGGGSNLTCP